MIPEPDRGSASVAPRTAKRVALESLPDGSCIAVLVSVRPLKTAGGITRLHTTLAGMRGKFGASTSASCGVLNDAHHRPSFNAQH